MYRRTPKLVVYAVVAFKRTKNSRGSSDVDLNLLDELRRLAHRGSVRIVNVSGQYACFARYNDTKGIVC